MDSSEVVSWGRDAAHEVSTSDVDEVIGGVGAAECCGFVWDPKRVLIG